MPMHRILNIAGRVVYVVWTSSSLFLIGWMLIDVAHFGWFDFVPIPASYFLGVFVDGAIIEESIKWLVMLMLMLAGVHPYFTPFVALGFGFGEAYQHYWYHDVIIPMDLVLHLLLGLVMAELLRLTFAQKASKSPPSRAKFYKLLILSLVVPIALHGAHNFLLDMGYVFVNMYP